MREESQPSPTDRTALTSATPAIASARTVTRPRVAADDAVVDDVLDQQRRDDDQAAVDDGQDQEDRDQPPVRAGRSRGPGGRCRARSGCARRCGPTAGAARRRPHAMHPRHRLLLLLAWPISGDQLAEPAGLRLALQATLVVEAPVGRRLGAAPWSRAPRRPSARSGRPPGRRRSRPARRPGTAASASPMSTASRGADHPRRGADLQRPGVANALDQRLCSRQVGHQAERGLLHAELRVVGDHPQVAARAPAGSRRRWRSRGPRRSRRTAGRAAR